MGPQIAGHFEASRGTSFIKSGTMSSGVEARHLEAELQLHTLYTLSMTSHATFYTKSRHVHASGWITISPPHFRASSKHEPKYQALLLVLHIISSPSPYIFFKKIRRLQL